MENRADSAMSSHVREWKNIEILGTPYIISTCTIDDSWKILVTDLVEIWTETITKDIASSRCQSLNPLLDLDSFDIDGTLTSLLNDIPKHATEISLKEIKLKSCMDGIMFKFTINLTKGSPREFWNEITKPLCQSSMELCRRHEMIIDVVKKKDEELDEYKSSGAQLIRKNIETLPFKMMFDNQISIPSSKSGDCVATFQSMINLHNELKKRESLLNYVNTHLPQGSNDRNRTEPDRVPKLEPIEASETTSPALGGSNTQEPKIKTEITTEVSPICKTESIAPKTEIIEQYETSETRSLVSESKIGSRTEKHKRKQNVCSIEAPGKKPKRIETAPNISHFLGSSHNH